MNVFFLNTRPVCCLFFSSLIVFLSCGTVAWAADTPNRSSLNAEEEAFEQLSRVGPTDAIKNTANEFLDTEVRFRKLGNSLATAVGGRKMKDRIKRYERFEQFFEKKQVLDTKAVEFIDAVKAIPPQDHPTLATCIDIQTMCGGESKIENIPCATRLAMCLAPHFPETAKAE